MSKPFEKKDEDNDANHDVQAPDGGWGWIVVVGQNIYLQLIYIS